MSEVLGLIIRLPGGPLSIVLWTVLLVEGSLWACRVVERRRQRGKV
jgi:hypothetical protein